MAVLTIAITKGTDKYIFLFDEESLPQLISTFARLAMDQGLNFTWGDAAELTTTAKRLIEESRSLQ